MRIKELVGAMQEAANNLMDDPEKLHAELDNLLLLYMPPEVGETYRSIQERAAFWSCA